MRKSIGKRPDVIHSVSIIRTVCLVFLLSVLGNSAYSQVYVGGGYVEAYLSETIGEDANGMLLSLNNSIDIQDTKWSFQPSIHLGLLMSNIDLESLPSYTTTLGFSALMGYDFLRLRKFVVAPFAGPFINWASGYRAKGIVSTPECKSEIRGGIEIGISLDIKINDHRTIKIVPRVVQFGNKSYQQRMIVLYIPIS